ncbi:hypothetical protein [Streptomyces sp. NPDC055058]
MDRTETARRLLGNDAAHRPYAGPAGGSDGHTPIYTALVAEWRARGQTVPGHREARWASFAAATVSEQETPAPTVPAARSVPFRVPLPVLAPEPARAPGREPEADADAGADRAGPGHTGADGEGGTHAHAGTGAHAGMDAHAGTDGDPSGEDGSSRPGGDHPGRSRDDAPAPGGHPALHLRAAPPGEALTSRPAPPAPH